MQRKLNISIYILRIYHTKKNIGTRLVSFAPNVEHLWLTNNLDQKQIESIVDRVMMHNLQLAAMAVTMYSEQV